MHQVAELAPYISRAEDLSTSVAATSLLQRTFPTKAKFHWFERSHYLIKQRASVARVYILILSQKQQTSTQTPFFIELKFHACSREKAYCWIWYTMWAPPTNSERARRFRNSRYTTLTASLNHAPTFSRESNPFSLKARSSKSVHSRAQHIASINYKTQHENLLRARARTHQSRLIWSVCGVGKNKRISLILQQRPKSERGAL